MTRHVTHGERHETDTSRNGGSCRCVKETDTSPHEPSTAIVYPRLASRSEAGETTIYGIGNDGIVPEIGDLPRPDFVIEEFECTLTDDSNRLRIAFICKNMDYRLNHKAEFEGTRKLK